MSLERFDPSLVGKIAYEHLHRYAFARTLVSGRRVLDVASGEGYGSAILAETAKDVIGCEIDGATVEAAQEKYRSLVNLRFEEGDCRKLPFDSGTFDVVVSFETIEHLGEQDIFIAEVRRVLKPDGFFILSTPNTEIYSPGGAGLNEFHVKELTFREFEDLLTGSFLNVKIIGQRLAIVSMTGIIAQDEADKSSEFLAGYTRVAGQQRECIALRPAIVSDPEYLIAICSNGNLPHIRELHSIFLDEGDDLWRAHDKRLRWASGLHEETESFRQEYRDLKAQLSRLEAQKPRAEHKRAQLSPFLKTSGVIMALFALVVFIIFRLTFISTH